MSQQENQTFHKICEWVKKSYPYEALILYGSRATQTVSSISDYDLAIVIDFDALEFCYRQLPNPLNLELDCVLIPLQKVHSFLKQTSAKYDEPFRYFHRGKVIDRMTSIGDVLLDKIEYFIRLGPEPISQQDKQERLLWLTKMMHRAALTIPAYQFRKYELFTHLLYNYFYLRDQWYLGVKESFLRLEKDNPQIYEAFLQIMNGNFKVQNLNELFNKIAKIE